MAVCIAVIAKENYPLFIGTSAPEDTLKFTYIVHTSLDVIEERVNSFGKTASDLRELYLGLLYPTEDYKVYGYITNTRVKFIIISAASNVTLRDNEIKGKFRKLHDAYVNVVQNPFYTNGEKITSRSFDSVIGEMMVRD